MFEFSNIGFLLQYFVYIFVRLISMEFIDVRIPVEMWITILHNEPYTVIMFYDLGQVA